MAQPCAPLLKCSPSMAHWCASGISMAQYYASGIWLNAVHPHLNDEHQISVWFQTSMMCTRHQYGICSIICIMRHVHLTSYGSILLNNLHHASIFYSSVLCIMHKNYGSIMCTVARCCASTAHWCASGISMAQCCVSGINIMAQT